MSSSSFDLESLEQRRLLSAVIDLRMEGGGKSGTIANVANTPALT